MPNDASRLKHAPRPSLAAVPFDDVKERVECRLIELHESVVDLLHRFEDGESFHDDALERIDGAAEALQRALSSTRMSGR